MNGEKTQKNENASKRPSNVSVEQCIQQQPQRVTNNIDN